MVNDGSTDKTWDIICELYSDESGFFKGIDLANNVGHQNAILAGMMTAKEVCDIVVTIDCDLQDDIDCIERMIDRYYQGNEIIYGVKESRKADPILKKISAQAFYRLSEVMGVKSIYNHADFRLMSKNALQILESYPERNIYLRALIPMIGLKSAMVQEAIREREAGQSKYSLKKMQNLAIDGITSFSIKPIYYILYLGTLISFLGLISIAVDVIYSILNHTNVSGWATIIIPLWIIGGIIMMSLGCIGIYIGKIFIEVKRRPLYNITKFLN